MPPNTKGPMPYIRDRPQEWRHDAPRYPRGGPLPKTRADGKKGPVPYLDEHGRRCINYDVEYPTVEEVRERLYNQMETLGFGGNETAFVKWVTEPGSRHNLADIEETPRQQHNRSGGSGGSLHPPNPAGPLAYAGHGHGRRRRNFHGASQAISMPQDGNNALGNNLNYNSILGLAGTSLQKGQSSPHRLTDAEWHAGLKDYDRRLMAQLGITDPKAYFRKVYLAPYGHRLDGHGAARMQQNVKPGVDYQKELLRLLKRGFRDAEHYYAEIEELMAVGPEAPSRRGIDDWPGRYRHLDRVPGGA